MTVVKNESFELKMAWREALKKPIAKPTAPKPKFDTKDDDWETDINYQVGLILFSSLKIFIVFK
jgi:hypothetical protein